MKLYKEYSGVLVLSGDGDFAIVLKYLEDTGKDLKILARGERTAREIRQLAGGDFKDFSRLRKEGTCEISPQRFVSTIIFK